MTRAEYIALYEKYLSGDCSAAEKKQLEDYRDDFQLDVDWDVEQLGEERLVTSRIYQKLQETIQVPKVRKISWYKMPLAAALAIATLSLGLYFYSNKSEKMMPVQLAAAPILPGSNKAILTLDDGSSLVLDNAAKGILANQGPTLVRKSDNGKLVYNAVSAAGTATQVKYNKISVPRGGQYQLVLADGSKVWLNAQSTLRFPVAFTGSDRRVELTGEAYFEIAKDSKKVFHVLASGTEIQVLGTHFNVNAYTETVATTLVEGAVRLKAGSAEVLLKPGQLGKKDARGGFAVQPADLESALAWKNGLFIFHDEKLTSIMEKVSRWYDVEVEYRGDVQHRQLYGKVSRYENVSELLKNMELTGIVHFKIEGRRIIVMP